MREIEILHAIVEQQEIRSQMVDRKSAALHAVAVDQHRDAIEIARKHERLVAGVFGIEKQGSASRYHLRHLIEWHMPTLGVLPTLRTIEALTLITTRQNRDLAAALAQRPRQQLDHRRLARAAHRDVANRHHLASEITLPFPTAAVTPQTQLHQNPEDPRKYPQHHPREKCTQAAGPAKNDIRPPQLELFQGLLHLARSRCARHRPPIKRQTRSHHQQPSPQRKISENPLARKPPQP